MRKIPTIFLRDEDDRSRVSPVVNPLADWVYDGIGIPTRKLDGTACMVYMDRLYARHTLRGTKPPPLDFIPAQQQDPFTRECPGWIPIDSSPQWSAHRDALSLISDSGDAFPVRPDWFTTGTYELCGPKVNGNPEGFPRHILIPHLSPLLWIPQDLVNRTFHGYREFFAKYDVEGIVFHHPDGEHMAKIKARDFGISRTGKPEPIPLLG